WKPAAGPGDVRVLHSDHQPRGLNDLGTANAVWVEVAVLGSDREQNLKPQSSQRRAAECAEIFRKVQGRLAKTGGLFCRTAFGRMRWLKILWTQCRSWRTRGPSTSFGCRLTEIGRASCRERVEISVVVG